MPIEIRELTIKTVVSEETTTAATGGDAIYQTQYGNNNAEAEPPSTGKTLSASLLGQCGADKDVEGLALAADGTQPGEGVCHGVTVLAWARVDGTSPSGDDVVVDGRIITGEGFEASFGDGSVRFVTTTVDLF
jgi:hypothetical protein